MAELPRQSYSYWLEISGDDDRLIATDLINLITGYYNVGARVAAPLEVTLKVRDAYGATKVAATTWEPMAAMLVQTSPTRIDLSGVSAMVELRPVSDDG